MPVHVHDRSVNLAHAKDRALNLIKDAGLKYKSPVLAALAMKAAADPFQKVKELIQSLVERLIQEAAQEATKKGFCDSEMGKAELERQYRWTTVQKLSAEISVLKSKTDSLQQELTALNKALSHLDTALKGAAEDRQMEKQQNLDTIKEANDGLTGVNEAITILRAFYKQGGQAALIQNGSEASPVDEDTSGPGFSGAYQGKVEGSHAVLGLLQSISSDFERTIRLTASNEKEAAEQYVKFVQATKADIGGKSTKRDLNQQDLTTTKNLYTSTSADMKTHMDLVDDAVKTIEALKPTCIDTSMSYDDRTAARQHEIEQLRIALCILDTEGVESQCQLE